MIVIEPGNARAEVGVGDARRLGNVRELAAALVVEEAIAIERRDVNVVLAVVVVIADSHSDSVDLDIETAAARDIGERPVVVIAIERGGGSIRPLGVQSLLFYQQNVNPAIPVRIDEEEVAPDPEWSQADTSYRSSRRYGRT